MKLGKQCIGLPGQGTQSHWQEVLDSSGRVQTTGIGTKKILALYSTPSGAQSPVPVRMQWCCAWRKLVGRPGEEHCVGTRARVLNPGEDRVTLRQTLGSHLLVLPGNKGKAGKAAAPEDCTELPQIQGSGWGALVGQKGLIVEVTNINSTASTVLELEKITQLL